MDETFINYTIKTNWTFVLLPKHYESLERMLNHDSEKKFDDHSNMFVFVTYSMRIWNIKERKEIRGERYWNNRERREKLGVDGNAG